ncbi:WD40 repeat-like protein [Gigaspora margarita]|uniref:Glutamate-rich WD repeat-containing protein 1 n=1 Tax=Gigaspora margarita TaxID=4874 RepID=A0A8H4AG99_GIGMA|nr:WD40 repeat-like protein [Gigaspora margarita]
MSKRSTEELETFVASKAPFGKPDQNDELLEREESIGEFEDPWEDEFESESEDIIEDTEAASDNENAMEIEESADQVYLPGQELGKDEFLEADQSVYEMLHSLNVKWPCLSFDILHDSLGEERKMYPATAYIVAGTQADKPKNNELIVMKMSQLHKTQNDGDDSDKDSDSDDGILDENPILESKNLKHYGGTNRVRIMPQRNCYIAATWAETGKVHIWDLAPVINSLDTPGRQISQKAQKPLYTVESHSTEGFAMDWSGTVAGRLITGDMHTNIYLTTKAQSTFTADRIPFVGHTSSVEDLQWSPVEKSVFASASADQTICIWDIRSKKKAALSVKAHEADVNVITWNRKVEYLLASGADDGVISIWDLRTFMNNRTSPTPVATFKWHSAPITSIEWSPIEESVFAASGSDDQISIWDLSVEHDPEESSHKIIRKGGIEVPSQLLFIHQGQNDIKEIHWHPQIPGCMISTAASGFNVFKTISV